MKPLCLSLQSPVWGRKETLHRLRFKFRWAFEGNLSYVRSVHLHFIHNHILFGSWISNDEVCHVISVLASSGMTSSRSVLKECCPTVKQESAQSHPPINLCPGFRMSFTFPLIVLTLSNNLDGVLVVVMRLEDGELTGRICSWAKSSFYRNNRLGRMRSAGMFSQWGEGKGFPRTKGRRVKVNMLVLSGNYAPSPLPFHVILGLLLC